MPRDRDEELERELAAHLELEAEEQREAGRTPEQAHEAARRALGSTIAIKEDVRATRRGAWLETWRQDLRYAWRMLRKSPAYTAAILASLAVGIGLNASVFSVLNAALLRPLPVPEPERLVRIFQGRAGNLSYPNYRDLQARATRLQSVAAFSWPMPVALSLPAAGAARSGDPVWSAAVSANYFDVLGVRARHGRTFRAEEESAPGAAPVVVLGDRVWRDRFAADPAVVGRTVRLNGFPFEVIGVAPPDMPQPDALFSHQLWVPAAMCEEVGIGNRLLDRRQNWVRAIGRLRLDADLAAARAELAAVARSIEADAPREARELTFTVLAETSARLVAIPGARKVAWILQALVALVLAIACVNIANLQVARSLSRGRELATRMAIGAGRGRIVRQLVTESLLVTLAGGLLGILAAVWGSRLLLALAPPLPRATPVALDVAPDWRVVVIGLGASLAVGAVLGLTNALGALRTGLGPLLKSGDRAARSRGWLAPRRLLVGAQVALSGVLLLAAALFLESLANARGLDLGFRPEDRLALEVSPGMLRYPDERIRRLHADGLARLQELPGVVSASSTIMLPLSGGYLGDGWVWPEGDVEPSERGRPMVFFDRVGVDYLATMGATLVRGREFTAHDGPSRPPVAVVNESFAERFWPGQEPLGKRFRTGGPAGPLIEVVGVVRDGRYNSLGEEPQLHVYQPFRQGHAPSFFFFVVRTNGDTNAVAAAARAALQQLDPELPVAAARSMREHLRHAFWGPRAGATLVAGFALLGLALSAAGLYGVLAFLVSRSVPEIAVRMALGAPRRGVLWLVLKRGLSMAAGGVAVGMVLAAAVARGVNGHLYGVPAWNPVAFAGVAALLLAVAGAASYLPARRAVKIDPVRALRQE